MRASVEDEKPEEIQRPLKTGDLHAKGKTGKSSYSKRSQKNAPTWAVGTTECYQDCNEGREKGAHVDRGGDTPS